MKEWLESHRELVRCAGLGPVAVPMGLVALVLGLMVLAVTEDQVVSMYKASHYVDEQFSRAPGCHPDGGWNSRLVGITACPVSIARPHIDENAVKSPGYMLPGIPLHPGQDGYGFVFDGERDPSEISTVAITVEQYQYRPVASTPPPGGGGGGAASPEAWEKVWSADAPKLLTPGEARRCRASLGAAELCENSPAAIGAGGARRRRVYRSRGVEIGGGGGEGEQTQAGWLASCESLTHIRKGRRGSCPLDEFFETVDLIPSVVGPPRTEHQKAADGVYQPGSPVKLSSLETCAPAVGGDPAPRRYIYTTKGPASSCTPRPGADLRFSWTAVFLKRGSKRPLPLVSALAEQRPGTLDADGKPVGGFWNVTAALASKDAGAPDEYYLTGWTNQESSAMVVADVRAAAAGGSTSGHVHFLAWLRLRKPGPGVWAFRLAGWLLCWLGVHLVLAGVLDRSGCVPWAAEWAREACRLCCLLGGRRANPQQQYAAVRTSQWQPPPQAAPRYFGLENTSTALLLVYGIAGATFSTLLTIGFTWVTVKSSLAIPLALVLISVVWTIQYTVSPKALPTVATAESPDVWLDDTSNCSTVGEAGLGMLMQKTQLDGVRPPSPPLNRTDVLTPRESTAGSAAGWTGRDAFGESSEAASQPTDGGSHGVARTVASLDFIDSPLSPPPPAAHHSSSSEPPV